jgi:hypothetical protein
MTLVILFFPSFLHKWEKTWHFSLWDWLISLHIMISSYIHFSADDIISFFLTAKWNSIVYIHIFFIHSSPDEQLGWFYNLAVENNVVINNSIKHLYSNLTLILLGIHLEVEWLEHTGVLFLIFWGNSTLISIVARLIYIPTSSE